MNALKRLAEKTYKICVFILTPIVNRVKSGALRRRSRYAKYYKRFRVKSNLVLYEAFFGRGMLCNPYAIFSCLLKHPQYKRLIHVWVLDDVKKHQDLIDRFKKVPNVKFVQYQSRAYLKYLCRAKYLVNNSTFPSYFTKKEGQIYVNTWHGVPLKKMGFDMPNGQVESSNTIRNLIATDYLLSTGPILTKMYTDSYKLKGIYEGVILDSGYPRLDLLKTTDREEFLNRLSHRGVQVEKDKEIILYAPTWRWKSFESVSADIEQYISFKEWFDAHIDTSKYQLLIKVHQSVYAKLKEAWPDCSYMIPSTIDANEMLSVTDILISDYSSIFFDFLATDRPIIFYIPYQEQYEDERGTNFSLSELPGSVTTNIIELCELINTKAYMTSDMGNYQRMKQLSCNYEIGEIASHVIDTIWGGKDSSAQTVSCQTAKKKILISRARMRVNGISTSLLNLLNGIDYDKYDVTLQVTKSSEKLEIESIRAVNPNVRVLVRVSTLNTTLWGSYCQEISSNYGRAGIYAWFYRPNIYKQEFKRCYGDCVFDYIFDFDGYNTYYSLIHLAQPHARTGIWLHNDMVAEKEERFPWLKKQFEIYPMYDYLISCSKEIMQVNRQNLASSKTYSKFTYAKNMVGLQHIERLLEESWTAELDGRPYCVIENSNNKDIVKKYITIPLQISKNISDLTRFITIGRLSPEKNHRALIDAFSQFVQNGHNAMLYILGDGPLRKEIEAQISQLGLSERVIMTGNIRNPFAIMKCCDCFILPSLHEGQPMVIHEARVIGLPIIMSKFSSAEGSMLPGGQYLIGTNKEDILDGLNAFIDGRVPCEYVFDASQYNREAYEEFLCAIGEHEYSPEGTENA